MKVSIIITSYNYGAFLGEAIDSALGQTHTDTEVIVVDDGSRDNSAEIINGYGDRIIPVFRENGGQCASFNTGFELCHGDVVILLDADDILTPSAVARQVEHFQDPDVVKSCGFMEIIDADGNRSGDLLPSSLGSSGDYLEINLQNGPNIYQSSFTSCNAWSRSFLEKIMPLPENDLLGSDGYLTAIEWLFGRIAFIHEAIALYRFHGDNKGPMNFSFDTAYMKKRVRRWDYRNQFAEMRAGKLGYRINRGQFWKQRNWRLNLMSYTLGLLGENDNTPSLWTLASSPFQRHSGTPWKSASVALLMSLVWLLPGKQAIGLARYLLTSRLYGTVKLSQQ